MELKIGQVWKENDGRFGRLVTIVGFEGEKVLIKGAHVTRAKRSRFNGKSGGYSLREDTKKI